MSLAVGTIPPPGSLLEEGNQPGGWRIQKPCPIQLECAGEGDQIYVSHCEQGKGSHTEEGEKKAKVVFHVLEKCLGRLESKGGNYKKVNFVLTLD